MLYSWRAQHRLQKLLRSWREYRRLVSDSLDAEGISPRQEEKFLALKARIASQLQSMAEIVPSAADSEIRRHAEGMTRLLQSQLSLQPGAGGPPWDKEKFQREWQEHFLYLNKVKSMHLGRRPQRALDPSVLVPTGFPGSRSPQSFALGKLRRFVTRTLLLILLATLAAWAFGVRWDSSGKLVIRDDAPLGQPLSVVLSTVSGWWISATSFFAPVLASYGSVVSIVLFGVLLLSLGYWVFVHS